MPPVTPQVQPLPRTHRRFVFLLAVTLFVLLVPSLVFYAVGYRFDPDSGFRNIMSVGGMYINTEAENVAIYIDDEPVEDLRIFQRAAYIQNVEAGMHQIHVQGEGVYTWVKQLPVFSHFVTEAASFNMPLVPQFRLIPEFQTSGGEPVVTATNTPPFSLGSTTQTFVVASTTPLATSTYQTNPEFAFIETLFASTTEERALLAEIAAFEAVPFLFSDEVRSVPTTTATTTVLLNDMELHQEDGDVFAAWRGDSRRIPYYFCVNQLATTTPAYGSHVTAQLYAAETASDIDVYNPGVFEDTNRLCRTEIRIDNKGLPVISFAFLPDSRDHVLMHLTDGIHVVEIDDRSWQNTQLLYPGENLTMLVNGGKIYVYDEVQYFELFTELQN